MAERTTAGLLGDFLAGRPGQRLDSGELATALQRDRTGVNEAIRRLAKVGAITSTPDPKDRRRALVGMTQRQIEAWTPDAGATAAADVALITGPVNGKAASGAVAAKTIRRAQALRFGLWNDGALMIDGLARKQLTLSPEATANLAQVLAALPEGALQALIDSPLKPSFNLRVDGRDYPMDSEQTAALVAYVEALPARAIRPVAKPDHRLHRIETPADAEGVPA